ncbi:hypothetical protein KAI52_00550 [Candidatus Parcubacteria bacterium]|nr:hypothetical protein [Candidatus Parcubacteria bacterium]
MRNFFKNQSGTMLIALILIVAVFIAMAGGLANLGVYRNRLYRMQNAEIQAMHIAEAGVNYYRWHLAHEQEDFFDGTGVDPDAILPNGPYEHPYISPSGELTGNFSLEITPPPEGSTIATIKSTGWTDDYPNLKRTVEVRYGIPSLAHYSFLTNTDVWFGDSETVSGELHSNGGIRMDGSNDSLVSSARSIYICSSDHECDIGNCSSPCSWIGGQCECPGIWGSGINSPLWSFPVPTVDFNVITMDIAQIKADAQSDGIYLASSGGGKNGYHIIFQADGTIDVYIVNDLDPAIKQYNDDWTDYVDTIQEKITDEIYDNNYSIPVNGLIYIEDDIWVEGTVNGRATLVAAALPDNPNKRKTIHINGNINYLARDGSHILGLVGQKHIKVPRHAPTDLTIDAILLAQNGRVFRNLYDSILIKNSITVYGGIITNQIWTWTWVDATGTIDGYNATHSIYDSQTTFAPPPSFPTTGEYTFISWEEK